MDFAFHGIHATFLIQIHMYMMNTMVVRKLLGGFKHMTIKIAQQIESMSTFRNLVWHEFEIITAAICMVLNSNLTMYTKLKRQY